MKPLDDYDRWADRLEDEARKVLSSEEYEHFAAIPRQGRHQQLKELLQAPIVRFSLVNEVFFRARWSEALQACRCPSRAFVLEVASGAEDCIPQAMARTHPESRYVSANLNRQLTQGLRSRTADLPLQVEVIEDDAKNLGRHLGSNQVDAALFHHGVNDVIQGILCDRHGIDTVHCNWMAVLPEMVALLRTEAAAGTYEAHVKGPFLGLVRVLQEILKPGGTIAMFHFPYQMDLDLGYPPEIYKNMIPITRCWTAELSGIGEISISGFDPQWWLFLRKE